MPREKRQMNDPEEKISRLRRYILFCAAVSAAAFALALSGWNDKWTIAAALVAAACIFHALLSHKKMFGDAMRDSAGRIQTLERDLNFYADIFELNPAMLFIVDDHLRVVDCNRACVEFAGADTKQSLLEELTSKIEADIPRHTLSDGFTESLAETIRKAGRDGFSRINTVHTIRDGTDRCISLSFRKISVENGFILAGVSVDTTGLHRVKEELIHKNKTLGLVNRIAVLVNSAGSESAESLVRKAADIMGRAVDADRISISKKRVIDGVMHFTPKFVWSRPSAPDNGAMKPEEGVTYMCHVPAWE